MTQALLNAGDSWIIGMISKWLLDPDKESEHNLDLARKKTDRLEQYCIQAREIWEDAMSTAPSRAITARAINHHIDQRPVLTRALVRDCSLAYVACQRSDPAVTYMHLAAYRLQAKAWQKLLVLTTGMFHRTLDLVDVSDLV